MKQTKITLSLGGRRKNVGGYLIAKCINNEVLKENQFEMKF